MLATKASTPNDDQPDEKPDGFYLERPDRLRLEKVLDKLDVPFGVISAESSDEALEALAQLLMGLQDEIANLKAELSLRDRPLAQSAEGKAKVERYYEENAKAFQAFDVSREQYIKAFSESGQSAEEFLGEKQAPHQDSARGPGGLAQVSKFYEANRGEFERAGVSKAEHGRAFIQSGQTVREFLGRRA